MRRRRREPAAHPTKADEGLADAGRGGVRRTTVARMSTPVTRCRKPDPPHIHRYRLIPCWNTSGEVDSWWWCTEHRAGEWVKIEDDPDAAYAIPGWPLSAQVRK